MTDVLSQGEVEGEIMRLSAEIDGLVEDLSRQARAAAEAEHAYKLSYAKAWTNAAVTLPGDGPGGRVTDGAKDAHARIAIEEIDLARRVAQALYESARDALHARRAQLSALQTLSANLRAVT